MNRSERLKKEWVFFYEPLGQLGAGRTYFFKSEKSEQRAGARRD
jgi:hypothetical protein